MRHRRMIATIQPDFQSWLVCEECKSLYTYCLCSAFCNITTDRDAKLSGLYIGAMGEDNYSEEAQ